MRIGELFVALNFKVDGQGDLAKAYNDVQNLGRASGSLALGVGVVTAGFTAMVRSSASAGNALKNFQLTTGLSTDKLQQWQFFAKQAVGSGEMVAAQVTKMQRKMADAMVSNNFSGLTGWTMFGLDPSKDPFEMLDRLNAKFQTITDPKKLAVFGRLLQDLGMDDNWMAIFRRSWTGKGLSGNLLTNQKDIDSLDHMQQQFVTIETEIELAGRKFSSVFSPALDDVTAKVDLLAKKWADLSNRLNSGTPAANNAKSAWNTGAEAVGAVLVGATALAGVIKLTKGVVGQIKSVAPLAMLAGKYSPYALWTAAFVDKGMDFNEVFAGRGGSTFGEKANTFIKPPFWDPMNRLADKLTPWAHVSTETLRYWVDPRIPSRITTYGAGHTVQHHTTINVVNPASGADGTRIGHEAARAYNEKCYLFTRATGSAAGF